MIKLYNLVTNKNHIIFNNNILYTFYEPQILYEKKASYNIINKNLYNFYLISYVLAYLMKAIRSS